MVSKIVTIHEFIIRKELTLYCKLAYSKYKVAMESARTESVSKSRERKRKILIDEIANVKLSKVTLESCVTTLCKVADALTPECENKQDPVEIVKLVSSTRLEKQLFKRRSLFQK